MNSGSFFRLDLDTSKVAEGITFFNYLDAPDFRDGVDCLRYPIRVAISSENVSFFIHYFDDYKAGLINDDIERKEEVLRPHHAEETILLLPYGSTDPEELSSSIKRIYNTTFPIGSSYLKELIEDRYIKKYEDDTDRLGKCERGYKRLQNSKVNKDSYSSLYIWGLLSSDDRIIVTSDSNRTISKFLRKLLLDFMFDLMHSDVFESSKYYAQMREGLMSDFFFSSIVKKSEYYYYRRLVRNRFKSVVDSIKEQKSKNKVIKDCSRKLHRIECKKTIQSFWQRLFHSSGEQIETEYQESINKIKVDKRLGPAYETIQELRKKAREENKNEDDAIRAIIKSDNEFEGLLKCVNCIRKQERRKKNKEWWASLFASQYSVSAKRIRDDYKDSLEAIESQYESSFALVKSIKGLYAEKLDDAESEWTTVIMGPLSDKHFSFSPEWYEDQDPRQKRSEFSVSESWFVNPEEEMARICFPLTDDCEQSVMESIISTLKGVFSKRWKSASRIHYLNSLELSELIGAKENTSVADRNTKISKWFYRRFDFDATFRLYAFKYWNQFFASILLAFGISAIVPRFWMCPKNIALFPLAISACFLLSASYLLIYSRYRRKDSIDDVLVCRRRKRESLKSFRYSLLCAAIWAILFFYDDFDAWPYPLIKVLTLLGVSFILLRWIKPQVHILNNIHLFLPRLVASITAAWIIIVIGNDLVKEHLSWPICVVLSFIVFFFILYESYKSLPNILTRPRIWRALELMLISFSISLIIGVFAIDILSPSLLSDIKEAISQSDPYNINIPEYRIADSTKPTIWPFVSGEVNWSLTLFPPYLIQFSFLAMFIGVFIQMIFEEKNITEM